MEFPKRTKLSSRRIFFLPSPSPLSFFCRHAYPKGYYFYSPQSSSVINQRWWLHGQKLVHSYRYDPKYACIAGYAKGEPFPSKMVYKRVRGSTSGQILPAKTLLITPHPLRAHLTCNVPSNVFVPTPRRGCDPKGKFSGGVLLKPSASETV